MPCSLGDQLQHPSDIRDCELLRIKLEWRHCLEGAKQTFVIWMDHKSLYYLLWKTFCTALGGKVCHSSGFHPQTNGQTERHVGYVTSQNPPGICSYFGLIIFTTF